MRLSGRNAPPEKSSIRFSSLGKRTGASPSCRNEMSLERLPLSLSVRPRCEMRPLCVGALGTPFIQRQLNMAQFRFSVKEFQKIFSAMRVVGTSAYPSPLGEKNITNIVTVWLRAQRQGGDGPRRLAGAGMDRHRSRGDREFRRHNRVWRPPRRAIRVSPHARLRLPALRRVRP